MVCNSFSVFNSIRPDIGIKLQPAAPPLPGRRTYNPLQEVVDLARVMGLPVIPAQTLQILRDDPYFRYCFVRIKSCHLYNSSDPIEQRFIDSCKNFYNDPDAIRVRERLAELIRDPACRTDKDLYLGLGGHMNNFQGNLPDGFYNGGALREYCDHKVQMFHDIDQAMKDLGISKDQIVEMRAAADQEEKKGDDFKMRVEFDKLCLKLFNRMIDGYKYDPGQLAR